MEKALLQNGKERQYYHTEAGRHLESLLQEPTSVLIVGVPGSGKTTLVTNACSRCIESSNEGARICRLHKVEDAKDISHTIEQKVFLFLDDALEIWNQYPNKTVEHIKSILELHKDLVEKRGSCLLITIAEHTYERYKSKLQYLYELTDFKIINFSDNFKLSLSDRIGILKALGANCPGLFRESGDQTVQRIADIGKTPSDGVGFPLACSLFFLSKSFTDKKGDFFNEINHNITVYLQNLCESDSLDERCQYCTVVYACLKGGTIDSKCEIDRVFHYIAKDSNIDTSDLQVNTETFLLRKCNESCYKLIHEKVHQMIFVAFAYKCTGIAIVHVHSEIDNILRYIRTNESLTRKQYRNEGLLLVTNIAYDILATRLLSSEVSLEGNVLLQDTKLKELMGGKLNRGNGCIVM